MKKPSQILIFEDHEIVSSAVSRIVTDTLSNVDIRIADSFQKGLKMLGSGTMADLLILDVDLPGGESYGMITKIRTVQPGIRILVFTGQDEDRHALRFLSAGANGFLSKNAPMQELAVAIREIMDNKKYMPEAIQRKITDSFFNKLSPAKVFAETPLSPREMEVLELLLQGKWTKEIALELNLKLTTVSTHKARIFEKMQVKNILELSQKVRPES
jgi:two-component system invasion response regulator UvrY